MSILLIDIDNIHIHRTYILYRQLKVLLYCISDKLNEKEKQLTRLSVSVYNHCI